MTDKSGGFYSSLMLIQKERKGNIMSGPKKRLTNYSVKNPNSSAITTLFHQSVTGKIIIFYSLLRKKKTC
jgi:hypothetical protein